MDKKFQIRMDPQDEANLKILMKIFGVTKKSAGARKAFALVASLEKALGEKKELEIVDKDGNRKVFVFL